VSHNAVSVINYLIEKGADIEVKDNKGNTPLLNARDLEAVKCLVEKGAHVDAVDSKGHTLFYYACEYAQINGPKYGPGPVNDPMNPVIMPYVGPGGEYQERYIRFKPIYMYLKEHYTELRKKANVDRQVNKNQQANKKSDVEVICEAVQRGDLKTVKNFVEKNPSILKIISTNPIVSFNGDDRYTKTVRAILAPDNVDRRTLLHFAAIDPQSFEVLKYLIEQKAEVDAVDGRGLTPLFLAAVARNKKAVLYLLEHGAERPQPKHYYQLPAYQQSLANGYAAAVGGRVIDTRTVEHYGYKEVIETVDYSAMFKQFGNPDGNTKTVNG
jgi:ankyrin repeat protein